MFSKKHIWRHQGSNFSIIVKLDSDEVTRLLTWKTSHRCKFYDDGSSFSSPQGAIGGATTYQFTPTSLGTVVKVICACGSEIDLTDYLSW